MDRKSIKVRCPICGAVIEKGLLYKGCIYYWCKCCKRVVKIE